MKRYIDIHSHILPQLDDGSKNMDQTLEMLKTAYEEGIKTIITTPHYHEGRSVKSMETVEACLQSVRETIREILPQMNLFLGCEIYYSHDCVKLLNDKKIPTMADSRYVLVEFSPRVEYRYQKNAIQELLLEGYCPIIAHIERYEQVAKDIDIIKEYIDMGAYIQANAMSVLGGSGRSYKRILKRLLKNHCIHFIATDAHSNRTRAPRLQKCVDYITKKYGSDYAKELFIDNPNQILSNEYL